MIPEDARSPEAIAISGLGVVSPLGMGIEEFEEQLYAGESRFRIEDFDPKPWLGRKGLRALDRSARMLTLAAHFALRSSGLRSDADDSAGLGLVNGTLFGSVHSIASFDLSGVVDRPKFVNPMAFPNTVINSSAGQAAIKQGLKGVNATISSGLCCGIQAIEYAAQALRLGRAWGILAGGTEEACQESSVGFGKNGLLSPTGRGLPFHPERDGFVLGEGSALLALETVRRARKAGRTPLALIRGFGESHCNRGNPHSAAESSARAQATALESAGIGPDRIGLIVSGASGAPQTDQATCRALRRVFAGRLAEIPACAPKAAFGEALGASGGLLAAIAAIALRRGYAPPTPHAIGLNEGPRLTREPQPLRSPFALVEVTGCDGNSAALVLSGLDESARLD